MSHAAFCSCLGAAAIQGHMQEQCVSWAVTVTASHTEFREVLSDSGCFHICGIGSSGSHTALGSSEHTARRALSSQ